MTACDYCVCWFCNLRKECPTEGNRCEKEEQVHCPNSITIEKFECSDADFEMHKDEVLQKMRRKRSDLK